MTTPIKRYWLFTDVGVGTLLGGARDFEESFDTMEEAELYVAELIEAENQCPAPEGVEWHIFDAQLKEIRREGKWSPEHAKVL